MLNRKLLLQPVFQGLLPPPRLLAGCRPGYALWASSTATDAALLKSLHDNQEKAASRPPRFYVPQFITTSIGSVMLEGEEARHALKVLRLREGDTVELCDGQGSTVLCAVSSVTKGSAVASALAPPVQHTWEGPEWCVAVACTTLKGGRVDWLVEKVTELGAAELLPLVTERSQAGSKNKFKTKSGAASPAVAVDEDYQPGRLERLAVAACKQSLRAHALRLYPPTPLAAALSLVTESEVALVAVAGAPPLRQVMSQFEEASTDSVSGSSVSSSGSGSAGAGGAGGGAASASARRGLHGSTGKRMLLVGPEGDFTPAELSSLVSAGARPVGLGNNRLRTETAAMALLAACLFR